MADLTTQQARETSADDLLAIIVSGKNPDGTDWSMPTDASSTGSTTASPRQNVSIGTGSTTAVNLNASRKGLVLTSLQANTGQIALSLDGGPAELNKGIVLYPGDSFSMDDRSFCTTQINAISDVAAQTLAVQELT